MRIAMRTHLLQADSSRSSSRRRRLGATLANGVRRMRPAQMGSPRARAAALCPLLRNPSTGESEVGVRTRGWRYASKFLKP
jgi:hypothetical protein